MPRGVKGSGKGGKQAEAPSTPAEEIKAPGTAEATKELPSGASLAKKYKAQRLSLKDAFQAALKENPGLKEASFKTSYYTAGKTKAAAAPGAVKARKKRGPNKPKVGVATPAVAAAGKADDLTITLNPMMRQLMVGAIKEQIASLQAALEKLK